LIENQIPERDTAAVSRAAAAAYLINISPAALVKHGTLTGVDEIISAGMTAAHSKSNANVGPIGRSAKLSAAEFLKGLESCP
jgi:hypothetical protein